MMTIFVNSKVDLALKRNRIADHGAIDLEPSFILARSPGAPIFRNRGPGALRPEGPVTWLTKGDAKGEMLNERSVN